MKIKALLLTTLLALAPMGALASSIDIKPIDDVDDISRSIPEPTSALLMLAGCATIVAVRRLRK